MSIRKLRFSTRSERHSQHMANTSKESSQMEKAEIARTLGCPVGDVSIRNGRIEQRCQIGRTVYPKDMTEILAGHAAVPHIPVDVIEKIWHGVNQPSSLVIKKHLGVTYVTCRSDLEPGSKAKKRSRKQRRYCLPRGENPANWTT